MRLCRSVTREICGHHEDGLDQDEDEDDQKLQDDVAHSGLSGGGSPPAARGSRILAGTPSASIPAGTSLVTTEPAPVRHRRPARSARLASCPSQEDSLADLRLVLSDAVVVARDRARSDIRALAQDRVADVAEWCCWTPASRRLALTSAKLPSLALRPIEDLGRR